jgi:anti-anti-sigma factor
LTACGARRVVIDFAGAAFIDSTVLDVLLNALTRLAAGGGELILVSDDRRILKILEVSGVERRFRIAATLTDAIASLSRPDRGAEGTA